MTLHTSAMQMQHLTGPMMSHTSDVTDALEQVRHEREVLLFETEQLRLENAALHASVRASARVVDRFAAVADPVVASDGYTYERADLVQYLTECRSLGIAPRSQLTNEPMSDVLVCNNSLKRMIALLQSIEPVPVTVSAPLVSNAEAAAWEANNGSNNHYNHNNNNGGNALPTKQK